MASTTAKLFIVLCATMMSLTVTDAQRPNCIYTWTLMSDTNYLGGIRTGDATLDSCKQTCVVNGTCNGVDWNPVADVGQRCWMSGPWSGSINNVAGLVHYSLRVDCPSNAFEGCVGIWGDQQNTTHYFNGVQVDYARSLAECQDACVHNDSCTGIDWNWYPGVNPTEQCFMSGPWTTFVGYDSPGIWHYELLGRSCTSAGTTTTPTPTPASTGGNTTTPPRTDECPLDILFILDRSGSVGQDNFRKMLDFVKNVVSNFIVSQSGVHVAAIAFDDTAQVAFRLTDYFTNVEVENAVSAIGYTGGGTVFHSAFQLVLTDIFTSSHGARSADSADRVVVFITDGQDTNPQAISDADAIRAEAIKLLTVGIGSSVDFPTLLRIVNMTENLFNASDFDQLSTKLTTDLTSGIGCGPTIPYELQTCSVTNPQLSCRSDNCCKNCTKNLCNDRGLSCCGCDCLETGPYQVCQCCPRNYHCCPYTPTFLGLPLARCCRNDQVCDWYMGSYRCLGKEVQPKPTELVCSLCDPMYLTTAAKSGISHLYIDGREYNLTSNSTLGGVSTILIPADAHVIVANVTGSTTGSGLIASVTHDYLLTNSAWKSTASTPSYDYVTCTYAENSRWLPAYQAPGLLPPGGGVSTMAKWIWTINNTSPNLATPVYFRAKFPQNVCDVDYGSCTNLCAREGKDCCHCEMARAGPTKVCACCPRNYHCCPVNYNYENCSTVCCPNGYQCSTVGRNTICSTGILSVPARVECGDCNPGPDPNITVCPLDLCFVIDSSESIGQADRSVRPPLADGTTWGKILEFIRRIVKNLGSRISYNGIRVAAVMFNDRAWIAFKFTWGTDDVLRQINDTLVYFPGATNLNDALTVLKNRVFSGTMEAGEVRNVPKMAVIITDGVDNIGANMLNQTAADCKNLGIRLLAVGITDLVNEERLRNVVTNNETDYWPVGNYDNLITDPLADDVSLAACNPENRTRESCVYFWAAYNNTAYPGGRPTNYNDITVCKDECIKVQNCTGINWSDQQHCSFIESPSRATPTVGSTPGSIYYNLTRDCRQCVYTFKEYPGMHRSGEHQAVVDVTLDECRTYCVLLNRCTGVSYNRFAIPTSRCWWADSSAGNLTSIGAVDSNGAITINHYELTRKGNECSPDRYPYPVITLP